MYQKIPTLKNTPGGVDFKKDAPLLKINNNKNVRTKRKARMNKKVLNINESKIFPFKKTNLNTVAAYFILKSKTVR